MTSKEAVGNKIEKTNLISTSMGSKTMKQSLYVRTRVPPEVSKSRMDSGIVVLQNLIIIDKH